MMWVLISLILRVVVVHGACNLPTALNGNWTTSNFRTMTIQEASHQMSMTQTFTGASGTTTDFNCLLIDGNRYVMQSNNTVSVFSGTTNIYIYMCISFTQTSTNSYIYYLYSDVEAGLNNYRLTGLPTSTAVTTASQVCTATPDAAEFNVMVNAAGSGYELGTIQCPSVLLGNFVFTYTRDGSTFCDTANATVNTCNNQSLTGILANDTGCDTANPFYSNDGLLGCIASVENAAIETFYVSLYNGDANVDSTNTYRFSCAAITKNTNGTVYLSVSPTACVSGQTSTTAPSPGALMVMNPDCIPVPGESSTPIVLIVLICVFLILLIVVIIIVIVCYFRYKKKKREKKREKKMLISDGHPLAERSIGLDTPATMEPVTFDSARNEVFRSPRRKKGGLVSNPMGESSMNLDFLGAQGGNWSSTTKPHSRMGMDPFTEMETRSILPLSQRGSKSPRSIKSRQSSFVGHPYMNGDAKKHPPLAITDSSFEHSNGKSLMNGGLVPMRDSRGPLTRERTRGLTKKELTRDNSMIKAPSIRSVRSIKAPSLVTESMKSSGAVVRVASIRGKSGTKPAKRPDKLTRSATSTRIGSVTRKNTMLRAKTVLVPTKTEDGPTDQKYEMDDFMGGEINTVVGSMSVRSEGAKSTKSVKSAKSAKSKSSAAPRRSSKKKPVVMPVQEASVIKNVDGAETGPPESVTNRNFMSKDLSKESFRTARELADMRKRAKKPSASKGPWKG